MIVISNYCYSTNITTGEKGRTHPLRWKKGEYSNTHQTQRHCNNSIGDSVFATNSPAMFHVFPRVRRRKK